MYFPPFWNNIPSKGKTVAVWFQNCNIIDSKIYRKQEPGEIRLFSAGRLSRGVILHVTKVVTDASRSIMAIWVIRNGGENNMSSFPGKISFTCARTVIHNYGEGLSLGHNF